MIKSPMRLEQSRRTLAELKAQGETDSEEWRAWPQNPLYAVSSRGRVRRAKRGVTVRAGKECSLYLDRDGYVRVAVSCCTCEKNSPVGVHRLVAWAFLSPPRPEQLVLRHINGNRADNRVENLAWGTVQENTDDMIRHGTYAPRRGVECSTAKLTVAAVLAIRERYGDGGATLTDLAAQHGVTVSNIWAIVNRKSWVHL